MMEKIKTIWNSNRAKQIRYIVDLLVVVFLGYSTLVLLLTATYEVIQLGEPTVRINFLFIMSFIFGDVFKDFHKKNKKQYKRLKLEGVL